MKRLSALLLPLPLLAACASHPRVLSEARIPLVLDEALPNPVYADLAAGARPYVFGPFDTLSISVFGIEALAAEELRVDAAGRISFPLLGVVQASGRTPEELAQLIEQGLRGRYVRDPQVTVNLKDAVSQVITVDGSVQQPGLYPALGRMTLMRAVATAGGLSDYANEEDVVVFRTVEGQRMAGLYNLGAIRAGAYDDPDLFANDIVMVGDSKARRLFADALKAAPLLTTPLLVLLRN